MFSATPALVTLVESAHPRLARARDTRDPRHVDARSGAGRQGFRREPHSRNGPDHAKRHQFAGSPGVLQVAGKSAKYLWNSGVNSMVPALMDDPPLLMARDQTEQIRVCQLIETYRETADTQDTRRC